MRIVGGQFRGRPLAAPRSQAIRPTSDRTREAIFNVIAHRFPEKLEGGRVLDLFAGTGALGIEALSRGASSALFVEQAVEARALLRENIEALGLTGVARIFRRDATTLGSAGTIAPFDLVLADPPYGHGLAETALEQAVAGGWLRDGALVVVEEAASAPLRPIARLTPVERKVYGDTATTFLTLA